MKAAMTHGAFLPFWEPLGDFQSLLRPLGWGLSIFGRYLSIFGWDLSIFWLGPFYCLAWDLSICGWDLSIVGWDLF